MVFLVPFFLCVMMIAAIINERDRTSKNVLMLNPTKQCSYDFIIEVMLRFWCPSEISGFVNNSEALR